MADDETGRPLVGFVVFNEAYVDYRAGEYKSQVSTFVHEVAHALFFHPNLFQVYPKNSAGDAFLYRDTNYVYRMRGDHILTEVRSHFNCPGLEGGRHFPF